MPRQTWVLGERDVLLGVAAADVETVRFVEHGGIAVGGRDHHDHEIATRDSASPSRVSRVAKRSTRTTDGSRRTDSWIATGDQRSVARRPTAQRPGSARRCANRLVVIPSVVSIPAEQQHAGVRHDLVGGQARPCAGENALPSIDRPRTLCGEGVDRRSGPVGVGGAAGDRAHRPDDVVVPPEQRCRIDSTRSRASAMTRAASGPASSRRNSARSGARARYQSMIWRASVADGVGERATHRR